MQHPHEVAEPRSIRGAASGTAHRESSIAGERVELPSRDPHGVKQRKQPNYEEEDEEWSDVKVWRRFPFEHLQPAMPVLFRLGLAVTLPCRHIVFLPNNLSSGRMYTQRRILPDAPVDQDRDFTSSTYCFHAWDGVCSLLTSTRSNALPNFESISKYWAPIYGTTFTAFARSAKILPVGALLRRYPLV